MTVLEAVARGRGMVAFSSGTTPDSTFGGGDQIIVNPADGGAPIDLASMTPSNAELLELAKKFPPPLEWFERDEERPF